ncbi:MAG: SCP2 sterol-binding domain-containing protein [Chitinophagales bacterium]|nr:SCP2 sterol-binding domain-containing protein [Chitinophagales bacterium]
MKAVDMIKSLERRIITDDIDESEAGVFHFILTGEGGGEYTVELKNKKIKVYEGLRGNPDCEIKAKAADYEALERGELNPQWAYLSGKIKVSNLVQLLKFKSHFRKLSDEF